jgi:hypothetical protein
MKKLALVALVVALGIMFVSPASAFFGMFGGGKGSCGYSYCAPMYCGPVYCAPVYCGPAYCAPYCGPVACAPYGKKMKKAKRCR